MRTTVDLDPDLLERLRLEATRRRVSFKQLLNAAIRSGLATRPTAQAKPYVLRPRHLGVVREGLDLDKALAIADTLESRQIADELERRK